jgi:hypothetical protein
MAKTDPATWREAARQCREEASALRVKSDPNSDAAWHLESMARRFENEATAAQKTGTQ